MASFTAKVLCPNGNLLIEAARYGNEKTVLELLNGSTNVNSKDQDGFTALHYACQKGHLHIVKLLLERGAELEAATTENKFTPLHDACDQGQLHVVKYLLGQGANIEAKNSWGDTPLCWACYKGHLLVVKYLLDEGANIEATDSRQLTPLHWACGQSQFDVVEELLKRGANVNAKNNDGKTPSDYAKNNEIRKLFSDPKLQMVEQVNQLFIAASIGEEETVLKLLNSGTNVNAKDGNGRTPLHFACYYGRTHIVTLLLERGAELEAASMENKFTPLYIACDQGHLEAVRILVGWGANIEAKNSRGDTPLCRACHKGHLHIVKYLLDEKANIEVTNNNGWTSLHLACDASHFYVIRELLKRGANIHAKDIDGFIPSDYVITDEICKLFSEHNQSTKGQQNEVMELLSDNDVNFQYGPCPKMITMAKKRELDSKRYLEQIHNIL